MQRLLLLFLCCEWVPLLRWRIGFSYAVTVLLLYAVKSFLLAQLPLSHLYVQMLLLSQALMGFHFLLAAAATLFGVVDPSYRGLVLLNLFGKTKFTLLWLEPALALGFAALCAFATLEGDTPAALPFVAGQPMILPGPGAFWTQIGLHGQWMPMLLVPLVSALALRRYNQEEYAHTDAAFVEAATLPASAPPKKPPAGATIAGSAIAFPKVTGASRRTEAPSLARIGRSFR